MGMREKRSRASDWEREAERIKELQFIRWEGKWKDATVCMCVSVSVCSFVLVFVNLSVPDHHFSVSLQVMKADLFLCHPLPLLCLPTKRIQRARHPWVVNTTKVTSLQQLSCTNQNTGLFHHIFWWQKVMYYLGGLWLPVQNSVSLPLWISPWMWCLNRSCLQFMLVSA